MSGELVEIVSYLLLRDVAFSIFCPLVNANIDWLVLIFVLFPIARRNNFDIKILNFMRLALGLHLPVNSLRVLDVSEHYLTVMKTAIAKPFLHEFEVP